MKIAMMTNNYKPFIGGVPISVERLSESLRRLGHEVVVFAPSYKGCEEETEKEVRCRCLLQGIYCGFSLPDPFDPRIEERFRKENFDVIHVHHPMVMGRAALHLSKKFDVPLVFTYHTRYEQYLHYLGLSACKAIIPRYIRSYTRHCDTVLAPTPLMSMQLRQMDIEAPVMVLPTGIPEDGFNPDQDLAQRLRKRLRGDKKYLFCTISRLAKEKNIGFLLESLALRKENSGSDFRLVLIGEGPEEGRIKERVKELDLEEEVVFEGKVSNDQIKNYCNAADLFLFASTSETQGIVLLESMAAGTPVLAVDATGTSDIVRNGVNGFVTQETTQLFAVQLEEMLGSGRLSAYAEGARKTAGIYRENEVAKKAVIDYIYAAQIRRQKVQYDHNRKYDILWNKLRGT